MTQKFYIGTYTGPKSKGIYLYELDLSAGQITSQGVAGETPNPSFVALHPNRRFAYAVNEGGDFQGQKTGSVTAFSIDPSSLKLTTLNQQPSEGLWPCYLTVDPSGRHVLLANYGSGTATVLPIRDDGSLAVPSCTVQHQGKGPNPKRQEGPHAHSINFDPTGQFVITADLGIDQLLISRLDTTTGKLIPHDPAFVRVAPGAGPRHLSFSPDGRFAYLLTELANTIVAYSLADRKAVLTELQTVSMLPPDFTGYSSGAEVKVHPNGKFVYGSNRGHDSIAIFSADSQSGKLTPVAIEPSRGKEPRNFAIDPSGQYLIAANHKSDNLVVFRIDLSTGKLQHLQTLESPSSPVCVRFIPQS
jgi:6-phosphogluconolactonase